ncbi:MAG: RNase adapter RapZ [Rhodospirillales bacterium]|jgi:RNase adapter protein RapZ|nr:RNase adapter RapZ [Rhodospirillales bacterium]MBT4040589.1 RNase adapter RapZ [Rhodospirillales bacterium]MBT4626515.1 RNase adapter RapZ [Rhodospirillales bacterium]MBT5352806.1 RNase adapter RapZ [Rhodospirillales bacterium]MBT5520126.1 RNase adapter RapZ [Rhodospirillales bacterium]
MTQNGTTRRVIFVTGVSGAGKSTALNVFEDLGFEAVDNLPVSLLPSLLANQVLSEVGQMIAIGIDVRARDFDARNLRDKIDRFKSMPDVDVTLLFLDCEDSELENRFSATRRRHPLAQDRRVLDGIIQERDLLAPLKESADMVMDSTNCTVADFRHLMEEHFSSEDTNDLTIFVTSFSFAKGVPRDADMVFDVRFLQNPHYIDDLRRLSGLDEPIGAYISQDPDFPSFIDNLKQLLGPLLPRYADEGKRYLTIAVGCTGGRHRSVFLTETLAAWILSTGRQAQIHHRDLENAGK